MRKFAVITAVLTIILVVAGGYVVVRLSRVHVPFLSDTCRVFGDAEPVRLSPEQLGNAATIAAGAVRAGLPDRAATVALATGFQESKLRNLPNGDRDSVGLFQQRSSQGWGTPEQLQNPRYATDQFYKHLKRVRGWEKMRVTDAAQAVQRSGHPELYQQWAAASELIATALLGGETGAVTCQLREKAPDGSVAEDTAKLVADLRGDIGRLGVRPGDDDGTPTLGISVAPASTSRTGWQVAHWLVAKSRTYGLEKVAYAGESWTSKSGKWAADKSAPKDRRIDVRVSVRS